MEYTSKYQLSQWSAEDRILRTDFNADNAKIEAALSSLGQAQTLDSVNLSAASNTFSFDLNEIDWGQWQVIAVTVDAPKNSITYETPWACTLNNNTASGHGTASATDFLRFGPSSFLMALLPFRCPEQTVLGIAIGSPAGIGFGSCTYAALTQLTFASSAPYPAGTKATLWGVR